MSDALLITLASLAIGGVLAVATSRGHALLDVLRTFAVVAVATLAAVQLLPEAVASLGAWALLLFVLALALPPSFTWLWSRITPHPERMSARGVGAELGYFGFVAHQFVEGLALGTYSGPLHEDHDHVGLVLAVAAHTVPLTALFVGTVMMRRGWKPALRRLLALMVASAVGFAAAGWVATSFTETVAPTLAALVAGFLCHVLLHRHDAPPQRGIGLRALEVLAVLAGAALPLSAMHDHGELQHALLDAWLELALVCAPLVLLGLVLGALVRVHALPTIHAELHRRGTAVGMVTALTLFGPQLGADTLTLGIGLLGVPFTSLRVVAAIGVALVVGVVLTRVGRPTTTHAELHDEPAGARGLLAELDALLLRSAPWTVVGLLAAAYLAIAFPPGTLTWMAGDGLDVLAVALLALPIYVGAASATPMAAVLLVAGVSPGAVLVGLLLGPATNVATLAATAHVHGWRGAGLAVLATALLTGALALALELAPLAITPALDLTHGHDHGVLEWGSLAILVALLGTQLWRWGLGPWLEILDAGAHLHAEGHDHAHHDHAH